MGAGWPGTTYLCKFILGDEGRELIRGKSILEIGAGNGLPSFLCAQAGAAEVVVTDGDATEVAMLKKSVAKGYVVHSSSSGGAETECRFQPKLLWWGYPAGEKQMPEKRRSFDVMLACEVCYNPNDVQLVADTIDFFLAEGGTALVMNTCVVVIADDYDKLQVELKATWERLLTEKGLVWRDVDMLPFREEGQEQLVTDYFMAVTRGGSG